MPWCQSCTKVAFGLQLASRFPIQLWLKMKNLGAGGPPRLLPPAIKQVKIASGRALPPLQGRRVRCWSSCLGAKVAPKLHLGFDWPVGFLFNFDLRWKIWVQGGPPGYSPLQSNKSRSHRVAPFPLYRVGVWDVDLHALVPKLHQSCIRAPTGQSVSYSTLT